MRHWHRCKRYWRYNLQCAFHGKDPEEKRRREEQEEDADDIDPFTFPARLDPARVPARQGVPITGIAAVAEAVPVVAFTPQDQQADARAYAGAHVPRPNVIQTPAGIPIDIPDENIPQWTPPGSIDVVRGIGSAGEEIFTEFLNQQPNKVPIPDAYQQRIQNEFSNLALLFSGLFTANAIAHLWQSYNARTRFSSTPGPGTRNNPLRSRRSPIRYPSREPLRTRTFPRSPPTRTPIPPSRVPVTPGSPFRGGYGGLHFPSNPGTGTPFVPNQSFDDQFSDSAQATPDPVSLADLGRANDPGQYQMDQELKRIGEGRGAWWAT